MLPIHCHGDVHGHKQPRSQKLISGMIQLEASRSSRYMAEESISKYISFLCLSAEDFLILSMNTNDNKIDLVI